MNIMAVKKILSNERGSTLIIALILLIFLSIIGLSANNTATIEIQIAQNERLYKSNFYGAEGAAIWGYKELVATAPENRGGKAWHKYGESFNSDDYYDSATWNDANSEAVPSFTHDAGGVNVTERTRFAVVYNGLAKGESLDMDAKSVRSYTVFGFCDRVQGQGFVVVDIGYKG
ncbi:PilX N-terminal domain-containing pilus assembly protein [Desulfobacterales bacterium HSG16]|nr:PilX N-terminal domain-containing pilus assembly protein [Desulfobacterales bacterium HSG16]